MPREARCHGQQRPGELPSPGKQGFLEVRTAVGILFGDSGLVIPSCSQGGGTCARAGVEGARHGQRSTRCSQGQRAPQGGAEGPSADPVPEEPGVAGWNGAGGGRPPAPPPPMAFASRGRGAPARTRSPLRPLRVPNPGIRFSEEGTRILGPTPPRVTARMLDVLKPGVGNRIFSPPEEFRLFNYSRLSASQNPRTWQTGRGVMPRLPRVGAG